MRGKIVGIQPRGMSTVYSYICRDLDNRTFTFPVEHRYHREILMEIGDLIGREIEYEDGIDSPYLRFDFEKWKKSPRGREIPLGLNPASWVRTFSSVPPESCYYGLKGNHTMIFL